MDLRQIAQDIPSPLLSSRPCEAHRYHSPRPSLTHLHHVVPLSWGGPDTPSNLYAICPTGHYSVHALLSLLKKIERLDDLTVDLSRWGPGEREVALRGWNLWLTGSA